MDGKKINVAFQEYLAKGGSEHFDIYASVETFAAGWSAALAQPAQGEVKGWKLVPIEPTEEMIAEAISEYVGDVDALEAYRSMLAAAPIYPNKGDGLPEKLWQSLFWDLSKELKCLPSSFVDANDHVFNKARQLMTWNPLTDVQWMNIVNHDHAWEGYSKEVAVHEAVKMTEAKCKENNTDEQ